MDVHSSLEFFRKGVVAIPWLAPDMFFWGRVRY